MIISRTPFRISFVGGGTDFQEFYHEEPGAVISATINKYVFLSMHPLFNNNGYHLKYFDNEVIGTFDVAKINHPIIREVFSRYRIFGVDFNSSSDVPSGTGLGSSSSFTTGLINLCAHYKGMPCNYLDIAQEACDVEINVLGSPIGKQDQYAAAIGGVNFLKFNADESVWCENIILSAEKRTALENSLMLFYIGNPRRSDSILAEQKKRITANRAVLRKMVQLAETLRDELNGGCIDNVGKILHENWMYKKELSSNVTSPAIDFLYQKAMENGAEGGKLLGAGSGGFLLLFVPEEKAKLRSALQLYELPFKFEDVGTKIIYQ
jgi:D-glycero-alpha-D-manno-heptose-7-phosphate kinase